MRAEEIKNTLMIDETLAKGLTVSPSMSFEQRVLKGNYTLAEALAQVQNLGLEKVRSFISRGALTEASEIINLENQHEEVLFEKARMLCYSGDFKNALEEVNKLIKLDNINLLTKMTCHQIRALCHFELGSFPSALSEIDRVIALENIYPKSEASLFSRSLLVRVLIKTDAIALAQKEIENLWFKISTQQYPLNLNFQLIMYLRALNELKKHLKQNTLPENISGMWLAKNMQSPIHEGLFINTLSKSNFKDISNLANKDSIAFQGRFEIVRYFSEKEENYLNDSEIDISSYLKPISKILFLKETAIFDFELNTLMNVKLTEQNVALIKLIKNQKKEKEEVYKTMWNAPEYHPEFHDSAIRTAIKRLRENTGVEVVSENSTVFLKDVIIID